MFQDKGESWHTVEILRVKDEASKVAVARAVAEVSKTLTFEQTRARIESLPWTLKQGAPRETAAYLVKALEGVGAVMRVEPPLEKPPRHILGQGARALFRRFTMSPSMTEATAVLSGRESLAAVSPGFRIEPLSLARILVRSLQVCKRSFWKLIGISLLFLLMIPVWMVVATMARDDIQPDVSSTVPWMIAAVLAIGASAVITCGFAAATYYAVSSVYVNQEFGIFSSYRSALSKAPALVYTTFLFFLTIIILLLVLGLFGRVLVEILGNWVGAYWWQGLSYVFIVIAPLMVAFYVMSKFLLFDRVVILEDKRGIQALKRSWRLLSGKATGAWPARYWLRFMILMLILLIAWIAMRLILVVPVNMIESLFPESLAGVGTALSYVIMSIGDAVAILFWMVCGIVFYFDVRNRKEGFDVSQLAMAKVLRR